MSPLPQKAVQESQKEKEKSEGTETWPSVIQLQPRDGESAT